MNNTRIPADCIKITTQFQKQRMSEVDKTLIKSPFQYKRRILTVLFY